MRTLRNTRTADQRQLEIVARVTEQRAGHAFRPPQTLKAISSSAVGRCQSIRTLPRNIIRKSFCGMRSRWSRSRKAPGVPEAEARRGKLVDRNEDGQKLFLSRLHSYRPQSPHPPIPSPFYTLHYRLYLSSLVQYHHVRRRSRRRL